MFQKAGNYLKKLDHNLLHGNGANWSPIYGGSEGESFMFGDDRLALIGVKGRAGDLVNQLQFLFVDLENGQFHSTPPVGGGGGF